MVGFFNAIKNFNAFKKSKKSATMSGALVFFMLLGLVPTAYLLSLIFAVFGKELSFAFSIFTIEEFNEVKEFLLDATNNYSATRNALAGILAIYSSANLFVHIKHVGEIIYNHKTHKTVFIRAFSVVGTVVLGFIIVLLLYFYAFLSIWLSKIFGKILGFSISAIILIFIFFCVVVYVNLFCCPYKISMREVVRGSIYTCVGSLLFTIVFVVYLKYFSSYNEIYGKIAVIPAFFTWAFLLMRCLVTGFMVNAYSIGLCKRKVKKVDFK